ncbi:MAG: alpha/beta fold hydrolase [Panacagrimonas sp.]
MNDSNAQFPIKTIRANGLDFGYLEAGEGPLILLLHGFPDTAYGWSGVLPRLADAGFHAVAPFLRGYAPTSLAPDRDYSLPALARDLIALLEHFGGGEKARVVGHDWGSVITQYAANLRPDRFERIVLSAVPHLRKFLLAPTGAQLKRSHYIFKFQAPFWPERTLVRDNFAWLEQRLVRTWSPDWQYTEADLAPVKQGFADPARLKAALAYYRAVPGFMANIPASRIGYRKVTVPARLIFGSNDGCIGPEMFRTQKKYFSGEFDLCEATGMGHFMQCENPAWFADRVVEFFKRT